MSYGVIVSIDFSQLILAQISVPTLAQTMSVTTLAAGMSSANSAQWLPFAHDGFHLRTDASEQSEPSEPNGEPVWTAIHIRHAKICK